MPGRTKSNDVTNTIDLQERQIVNGNDSLISNQPDQTLSFERWELEGVDITGYHEKLRKGVLLPHTQYTNFSRVATADGQRNRVKTNGDSYYWTPQWLPSESKYDVSEGDCRAYQEDAEYLVQQAASSIYSKGHDTLTMLGELGKLKGMLKGVLPKIASLARGKSAGQLQNLWLEGRYGWRGLKYDIEGINDALTNFDSLRTRYSQRVGDSFSGSSDSTSGTKTALDCKYTETTTLSWNVSMRGAVTADITPAKWQANPVTTGWELVPFSFVIDWLVDVGTALETMSFLFTARRYSASVGYEISLTKQWTRDFVSNYGGYTSGPFWMNCLCTGTLKERIPTSVSIIPQTQLRLDEYKVLDLISLVLQRTRR